MATNMMLSQLTETGAETLRKNPGRRSGRGMRIAGDILRE